MAKNLGGSIFKLGGIAFLIAFLFLPLTLLLADFQFYPIPTSLIFGNALQALLSASFALILALPLAYVLIRRTPFSKILHILSIVPLVLPQPVMILSLIILFGVNGILPLPFSLYGLEGIVLAHALYNFPLAARIIAVKWGALESYEHVARVLGAGKFESFVYVTLPALRGAIFSGFLVAFTYSFTSFSIPLVFGGVANSTIEVEIFRTFFRDFNFSKGIFLAILQVAIFIPIALAWRTVPWHLSGMGKKGNKIANVLSAAYLLIFAAVLFGPFLKAKFAPVALEPITNSLVLALASAALCVFLWLLLGEMLSRKLLVFFAISPAVLAVAYYHLPYSWFLLPIAHAMLSLPLVAAILLPFSASIKNYLPAAAILGAGPFQRLIHVRFPLAIRAATLAFLFSFAFSMGETALLSSLSQNYPTMSMSLLDAFSHYKFAEGYFYSLLLICISIVFAVILELSQREEKVN
ncbi:MAG: hypothetical protein V1835_07055 [Candidatus Micrarchaeota archaeon]